MDLLSIGARLAGAAWDDITGLFSSDPAPGDDLQNQLNASASVSAAADPEKYKDFIEPPPEGAVTPLEAMSAGRISQYGGVPTPLPQMPAADAPAYSNKIDFIEPPARGAYVDALKSNAVSSPLDFAERYAGAYLGASGQDDPTDAQHAAVVRAAGSLAQSLPTDRDLTDTAIAIAHSAGVGLTPDKVQMVRNNVADEWARTGKPLMDLWKDTQSDPDTLGRLASPPPEPPSVFERMLELPLKIGQLWQGAAEGVAVSGDKLKEVLGEAPPAEVLGAAVGRVPGGMIEGMWNAARRAGEAMTGGEPLTPEEAIDAAALGLGGSIVKGVPHFNSLKLELPPGEAVVPLAIKDLPKVAEEALPAHVEASRIAALPAEQQEAELAKLKKIEPPAEGAQTPEVPPPDRAAVEELLPSYNAASGFYSFMHGLFSDKSGVLSLYHGTGVNFVAERGAPFGRFQMEKIGAGEGAQLYSHGLYFAQDERISKWYQKIDTQRKGVPLDEGSLYTVHVDVDPTTQMLDWDRKLGDQHGGVQEAVKNALGTWAETHADELPGMTGEQLFKRLLREHGATQAQIDLPSGPSNRLASEALAAQGLKGMQYTAGVSRGQSGVERILNYVIYDPLAVKITHRNGVEVPANTLFADLQGLMREGQNKVGQVLEGIHSNLPNWRMPTQLIQNALFDARREQGQQLLIRNAQQGNQTVQQTATQLEKLHGLVSPHVPEFEAKLKKGPAGDPMGTTIGQLISYIENRSTGVTLAASKMQPVVDAIRDVNLAQRGRFEQAYAEGIISLKDYIENYYAHIWKDARGPAWDAMFDPKSGVWSVPNTARQGSGASLRHRSLPTIEDGLRAGLIPRITDPIDLSIYNIGQQSHYLSSLRSIKEAKDLGFAYHAATGRQEPGDAPLLGVASSFPVGEGTEVKLYGKNGFHQSYNNAFSNGMFNHPVSADIATRMQFVANMSTAAKLALPSFHARVVGLANVASGFGQMLEELGRGQVGPGLLHGVESATVLPRVITDAAVGFPQMKRYLAGTADPIVQGLSDAGLRIGPRQAVYREASESLVSTGMRGVTRGKGFVDALTTENLAGFGREIVKAIGKDFAAVAGDPLTETTAERFVYAPGRAAYVPIKELGRLMQTVTAPLFDHMIPALKLGAGYRRMQSWLEANPTATEAAVQAKYRDVVRSLDNRFGELNQDTIFVPRMAKQIANMTMISPGWNYGSYRGFLGALGIDVEKVYASGRGFQNPLRWNPTFAADTAGLVAGYMIFNGIEQYVRTGTTPWQTDTPWKDLIAYRTGGVDKHGGVERGGAPSEMKEVFDLAKVLASGIAGNQAGGIAQGIGKNAAAAWEYALGKTNPFFQGVSALLTGHDAIGNFIYSPAEFDKFAKGLFKPIFLDAIANEKKGSGFGLISALIGDRVAPVAANWNDFIAQMQKVYDRENKQQAGRVARENAQLAHPDPSIPAPMTRGSSGQQPNLSRRERAIQVASGVLTDRQAKAGLDAYAVRAQGEADLHAQAQRQVERVGQAQVNTLARSREPRPASNVVIGNPDPAYTNRQYAAAAQRVAGGGETSVLRGGAAPQTGAQSPYIQRLVNLDRARQQRRDYRQRARLIHSRYLTGQEDIGGGAQGV